MFDSCVKEQERAGMFWDSYLFEVHMNIFVFVSLSELGPLSVVSLLGRLVSKTVTLREVHLQQKGIKL